jgi:hypothetical protein
MISTVRGHPLIIYIDTYHNICAFLSFAQEHCRIQQVFQEYHLRIGPEVHSNQDVDVDVAEWEYSGECLNRPQNIYNTRKAFVDR